MISPVGKLKDPQAGIEAGFNDSFADFNIRMVKNRDNTGFQHFLVHLDTGKISHIFQYWTIDCTKLEKKLTLARVSQ